MQRLIIIGFFLIGQIVLSQYTYEVSEKFPYGRPNPQAPEQIRDFEPMIGSSDCNSITRKQDGTWNDAVSMIWKWKYILNGFAVQDETLKKDGAHSGSIRQYEKDSAQWFVHWYASKTPSAKFPVWKGGKVDDKIILDKEQKAPNGTNGFFRLTFYDINTSGYKWKGEWVDTTGKIVYPTWKIDCVKRD